MFASSSCVTLLGRKMNPIFHVQDDYDLTEAVECVKQKALKHIHILCNGMWRSHFAQTLIWNRHQPPVLCLTNVPWRHQNRWRWMSTSWRASWVPMTLSWWNKPCEVAFRNVWAVMPNQSSKFHLSALTKSLASGFLNRLWQFQIYCMPLRSRAACAGFAMLQDGTLPCKSQREENLVVRKSCCTTSLSLALHSLLCKQKIHRWIAHAVVACQISHPCPLKANRSIHILAITVIWTALCRSSRTTRVERRCTWWNLRHVAVAVVWLATAAAARAWSTFLSSSTIPRLMKSLEERRMIRTHHKSARFGLASKRSAAPQPIPLLWSFRRMQVQIAKLDCWASHFC